MRLNKEIKNDIRTIVMDRAITPKEKALGMQQSSPTVYMPAIAIQTLDSIVPLP